MKPPARNPGRTCKHGFPTCGRWTACTHSAVHTGPLPVPRCVVARRKGGPCGPGASLWEPRPEPPMPLPPMPPSGRRDKSAFRKTPGGSRIVISYADLHDDLPF